MGLVFYRRQMSDRMRAVHKHQAIHKPVIDKDAAQQSTSVNSGSIKTLSPENLQFLKSIGIFRK
jgi:hypothetical protein